MDFYQTTGQTMGGARDTIAVYAAKTYLWMFLGMLVTFGVSWGVIASGLIYQMLARAYGMMFVLMIAQLVLVVVLAARITKLSPGAATGLFFGYAALNGVTLSTVFLIYEVTGALIVLGVTAVLFGIMGAWGYFTKQDLSRWGRVLMFGLLGLVIVGVLGLFLNFSGIERIVCFVGVAVFLGFTAYDTQKIKAFYAAFAHDPAMLRRASILSALQLYLDFINLFLYLLRLFGRRR